MNTRICIEIQEYAREWGNYANESYIHNNVLILDTNKKTVQDK